MKVRFLGQSDPLSLLNGKIYNVEGIQCGWYQIIDETGEDYMYPPKAIEVVEQYPLPPEIPLEPMPKDTQ